MEHHRWQDLASFMNYPPGFGGFQGGSGSNIVGDSHSPHSYAYQVKNQIFAKHNILVRNCRKDSVIQRRRRRQRVKLKRTKGEFVLLRDYRSDNECFRVMRDKTRRI